MIRINNLNKNYHKESVLKNININIYSPCFITLIGPSGCGKSTLLNILALLETHFDGEYYLFGKDVKELTDEERRSLIANQITYLFQEPKLIEEESVRVNLELIVGYLLNEDKFIKLSNKFNLKVSLDKEVKYLSKGEKKRLIFIGAILRNSPILICDEITSGLDEENTKLTLRFLKELGKKKIVILVSHDEKLVTKYCSNIYHFKDHYLPDIVIEGKEIKENQLIKNNRLSFKYLFAHMKKILYKKRIRMLVLVFSLVISLFTMGLSFLISDSIKEGITSSFTSYYGANQIILKSKEENKKRRLEVVDYNEFDDFYSTYSSFIEGEYSFYLANLENFFSDENYLSLQLNSLNFTLEGYGVRSFSEYVPLDLIETDVCPEMNYTLKENQIVVGLSQMEIFNLCKLLNLPSANKDALERYLLVNSIPGTLFIANSSWDYYLDINFEVVGFVITSEKIVYSNLAYFNEIIVEDKMKLPYSYLLRENDYFPWTTKKICALIIKNQNLEIFFEKMMRDFKMKDYSFHLLKEKDASLFYDGTDNLSLIYFTYKTTHSLSYLDLEEVFLEENNIISFLPCGSNSYSVDTSSLINGFERPTYLSSQSKTIDEFIDYHSFSSNDLGNYQSNYFKFNQEDFYALGMLDCSKDNFLKYKVIDKDMSLLNGVFPRKHQEIVISSSLKNKLEINLNDEVYLTSLVEIIPSGDKFQNVFNSTTLKVVGVVDSNDNAIYQDELFPLILSNLFLQIEQDDQFIDCCILNLKDNSEEYIDYLNQTYTDYQFINPLQEYLNEVNNITNYFSIGLLVFSLITLISSLFMSILVNYLFLKESEKEIAIYSFLGYQKKSIFNYFLMINSYLSFSGLIISIGCLLITSIFLPWINTEIEEVKLPILPFLMIIITSLVAFLISTLLILKTFKKQNIIELIKK